MKKFLLHFVLLAAFCMPMCVMAQQDSVTQQIKVSGDVKMQLTLTAGDLSKMPRSTATLKDHDGKEYVYSGVALEEILKQAGASMGNELRGKNHPLLYSLSASCSLFVYSGSIRTS